MDTEFVGGNDNVGRVAFPRKVLEFKAASKGTIRFRSLLSPFQLVIVDVSCRQIKLAEWNFFESQQFAKDPGKAWKNSGEKIFVRVFSKRNLGGVESFCVSNFKPRQTVQNFIKHS